MDLPKDKDDKADMSSTMASTLPMAAVCTSHLTSLIVTYQRGYTDVYEEQVSDSIATPLLLKYADGQSALKG